MFTGIVEEVGVISKVAEKSDIHQFQVRTTASFAKDMNKGDSVSINGVCLTAYNIQEDKFLIDVSQETQQCTTFGGAFRNNEVNLERALTPTTRLGGHFVSGHVDGIGNLKERIDYDNESIFWFETDSNLTKYIAQKGSICVNGVSLTINEVKDQQHCVTIIPHTLEQTTLKFLQPGDPVNIEVDLLARYLEQLSKHIKL